ncbi:MAG: hypothetical protein F6K23_38475 [Okeania sp. SIO2C9]|uniref:hypothetical protein n=1 Tax=Okeania sp. SIO2C9 TaxID=2607791 RepID=UPI0013C1FF44|nr:hypothetical protein [Okeania sp. SIO2C9]NEQ78363.1 hypothetical protein [Okeania sp. SIO2C9]
MRVWVLAVRKGHQRTRSSGDIERFSPAGSSLGRKELHLWCLTVVDGKKLTSRVALEIVAKFEHYKQSFQLSVISYQLSVISYQYLCNKEA